jgi:hypothetical protein
MPAGLCKRRGVQLPPGPARVGDHRPGAAAGLWAPLTRPPRGAREGGVQRIRWPSSGGGPTGAGLADER